MSAARICGRLFGALLERRELFVGPLPEQDASLDGEHGAGPAVLPGTGPARPEPSLCVSVCVSVPHRELQRPGQVQDMDAAPLQGLRGLPGRAHGARRLPGQGRS